MASIGGDQQILSNSQIAEPVQKGESHEASVERKAIRDRDEKLKLARERQNEERQRKIEELKAQAEAAQRYREQKEEERRRRIEEIRHRDTEKRHQVEERKRAIMEAEKERRDYILRKNMERECRLESKKRERSSIGFAFGSSTPRLLEPADFGTVSPSAFLGYRRATSISNVAGVAAYSRRSSERELGDCATKKRAASASGTDRRDGSQSGNVTPGGSMNSRPGSAMSTSTTMSTSGYVARRSVPAARKPRPASIAGTGVSLDEINKNRREVKPPVKAATPVISAQTTPKRTSSLMSTSLIVTSNSPRLFSAEKKTPSKKESSNAKVATPKPLSNTASADRLHKLNKDKPKDFSTSMTKSAISTPSGSSSSNSITEKTNTKVQATNVKNNINSEQSEEYVAVRTPPEKDDVTLEKVLLIPIEKNDSFEQFSTQEEIIVEKKVRIGNGNGNGSKENSEVRELTPPADGIDLMTASMIARNNKITTEEEAKAALAERRRLARVEAERQAELERQRIEAEKLAEIKLQEEEAERQRQFEEEATRLAEDQRKAEEERLRQAIEEAKQREEEERRKRDEDERQRLEREEAEKKAKEEAEKQRLEVAERLKREEKEREERRKRVEAIMSRTRKAGNANTPNSTPVKENTELNNKTADATNTQIQTQQQQQDKPGISSSESSSTSGSTTTATTPTPMQPVAVNKSLNSQVMYEQSVIDTETALINSFTNLIIDENAKNLQQQQQLEVTNGKLLHSEYENNDMLLQNTTTTAVANGNGHIENITNKK